MNFIQLFFTMLFAHCLADTALQPPEMGAGKNRNRLMDLSRVPPGQKPIKLWWMWLTHHSVIHGGVIWLISGIVYLGITEMFLHWIIDFFKCENKYNPYVDQTLHLLCKVVYCLIILGGRQ